MVNKDIVRYFKEGTERGFSIEELKQELIKHGHKEKDVMKAISKLPKSSQPKTTPLKTTHLETRPPKTSPINMQKPVISSSGKLGFFKKTLMSFTHPKLLFQSTKDEGTWNALKYYLVLSIIPFILFTIAAGIGITNFIATILETTPVEQVPAFIDFLITLSGVALFGAVAALMFLTLYIVGPIFSFIVAGLMHLGLKIVKAKGTYSKTYSAMIYSTPPTVILASIIGLLVALLPAFGIIEVMMFPIIGIWALALLVMGFAVNHEISGGRAFLGWLLGGIISSIILSMPYIIIFMFSAK